MVKESHEVIIDMEVRGIQEASRFIAHLAAEARRANPSDRLAQEIGLNYGAELLSPTSSEASAFLTREGIQMSFEFVEGNHPSYRHPVTDEPKSWPHSVFVLTAARGRELILDQVMEPRPTDVVRHPELAVAGVR